MVYIQSLGTRSITPFMCFTYIAHPGVVNRYRMNQAVPSLSSSSYDYWWPYPAAGDTPTSTALLTASNINVDSDEATSAQDAILPSDISTASLIQITALPPATTSLQAVVPKLPYHRQVNILYLVPLFIALGVVLGAITAAILLKWRRRLLRTSTLLPGPPYVPPENDVEDRLLVHGYPSMEQVSLLAASTPSKFTVHGSRYIPKRFAWQTLDTTQPPGSQSAYTQTIIPLNDGERFTVVTEDPFFAPSDPTVIRQSPIPSNAVALPAIRILPSLPESISGDNSSHHQAQDTNLPKPFRRSMFDILKLKGPYRPTPNARKEYTVSALDDESTEKTFANQVRRASSSKKTSLVNDTGLHGMHHSLDGEIKDALGLLGFRENKQGLVADSMVLQCQNARREDDIPSSPSQDKQSNNPRKVTPFTAENKGSPKEVTRDENQSITGCGDETDEETRPDIYTKAPQRRNSSRTPHKRTSTGGASRQYSAPSTHTSVLPLSPPSLMSPPLEKSLFLTSTSSSTATLATRMNSLVSIDSSPVHKAERSPEFSLFPLPSRRAKGRKKRQASLPEPPLPYPSYPDLGHAQPTPQKNPTSAVTKRRSVSPGSPSPKGRSTSAMHRESTSGFSSLGSLSPTSLAIALASSSSMDMLNKVNDIVARGYIKRRESMKGGCRDVGANLPDST